MVTQPPPEPPEESTWPTMQETTVVDRVERDTLVDAEPPYAAAPPSDRGIGAGMLLGLALVALVALGIAVAYLLSHRDNGSTTTVLVTRATSGSPSVPARIDVPVVTGRSFDSAQATLANLGFRVVRAPVSSTNPRGQVVGELPSAGSQAAKGSVVTLSVASGATLPATTSVTTTAPTTSTTTGTTTISAAPSPAPTPANATMPDVSGQTEQAAVTELTKAGVLPSLFFVPASDPLGTVEQQAKPANTTLPYHSHVQINISRGPGAKADAAIPNVVGRTLTEAVSTLNAAHLRLIYVKYPVTSRAQVGKIVQQSPLTGNHAPANAQVLVFVGANQT
ncbi:MAG TPA: PASTA domain-containing protein [Gaiellaceae bacterium]|nr:PASTA domain-containing protein [Gaiellaceae bacterium]